MMKRVFILISFIIFLFEGFTQSDSTIIYQVQYERTLTLEDIPNPIVKFYELTKFIDMDKSVFKKINLKTNEILSEDGDDDAILYFSPASNNSGTIFKDYSKNIYYCKHEVAYKYFVVEDNLEIFDWEILEDTKDILGFKCQLAKTEFRGRNYEAWFAIALPRGGPWKYDGLPGMILELKSKDNFIAFQAVSLKNGIIESEVIDNPFSTEEVLSWTEFTELYKKKAIELFSFRPDQKANGIKSSRGGIEMYIDKDDVEYSEALKEFNKRFN